MLGLELPNQQLTFSVSSLHGFKDFTRIIARILGRFSLRSLASLRCFCLPWTTAVLLTNKQKKRGGGEGC